MKRVRIPLGFLVIAVILLLNLLAASQPLHEKLHPDAGKADHECAITLFAHGHVDSVSCDVPVFTPTTWVPLDPIIIFSVPATTIENLPPGRGPPAAPSSQA